MGVVGGAFEHAPRVFVLERHGNVPRIEVAIDKLHVAVGVVAGKLQVELAQLMYLHPRLTGKGIEIMEKLQ